MLVARHTFIEQFTQIVFFKSNKELMNKKIMESDEDVKNALWSCMGHSKALRGFCLQNEMTKKLAAIHKSLNICSDFYRRKIITYLARLLFVGLNVTLLNV